MSYKNKSVGLSGLDKGGHYSGLGKIESGEILSILKECKRIGQEWDLV